jgi:2-desacetyl-2-hydroxyethyl bacteriochlorophyllide A dehydrogenase
MRAAIMEGPNRLVVRDLPAPEPGDYEALCQLLYGAVCAGTDQHLVAGHAPFCHWFKYPAVLGHESVGRVVKVGAKVRHLKVGDVIARVGATPTGGVNIAWGGFADFGIAKDWRAMKEDALPENQWSGVRMQRVLPAGIDPAAATMLITWRETWSYFLGAGAKPGGKVVVIGSGGNGLAFARHAVNIGAAKSIVVGSAARKAQAEKIGAQFLDYRDPNLTAALGDTCPGGADLIIDSLGKVDSIDRVLPKLARGGTVAVYGLDEVDQYRINPFAPAGTFTFYNGGYDEAEAHDDVIAFMQQGKLDARDFLTNFDAPFELTDIEKAIDSVRTRKCIKTLVRLNRT